MEKSTIGLKEKYNKKQRDLSEMGPMPPFPKIVKIDICNTCNYNCVFCPQAKQTSKVGCIDRDLCMDIILESYRAGARELCLSMTGEPLLNLELENYIAFAKGLGYEYVFFNTNGYLADRERGRSLLDAGVDSIKFSVNAASKSYQLVHGVDGYERVVGNIKEIHRYRQDKGGCCKLYVSYVAINQTLCEVEDVKQELSDIVDEIIVMNANNRGGGISEIEEGIYAGEDGYSFKFPCSQLFNNAYVTAEGYLVICCQDFENLTVVADLHKESIVEAWNNEKFVRFRKQYLSHDLDGTLCYNCINNTSHYVKPFTEDKAFYKSSDKKIRDLHHRIEKLKQTEELRIDMDTVGFKGG